MADPVILAIDQGTTNTKALLVDPGGGIVASAACGMTLAYPRPGWAEQSAEGIWDSVTAAIAAVVAQADDRIVAAVAISNQRETIVVWDAATGQAVAPAISWQCRRSSDLCSRLREAGHAPAVAARSGLGLDPLFSAGKLAWLLDSIVDGRARAASGTLRAGTVDSWLLWRLTDGAVHATDHGNASRTQLFDIHTYRWAPELAALFDVPLAMLPSVRASNSRFGTVAAGATALPAGVPIHAMMADSHAALFGHGVRGPGAIKATIGTGSSIMALTDVPVASRNGLSSTIAWSCGDTIVHALEGNITVSGQAVSFVVRLLGLDDEDALSTLAQSVEGSDGVVFVPALAGLGAPHWQDRARGLISGLSLGSAPAHVARAALDAVAFQIADVVRAMEADLGIPAAGLLVDGGATRNDFLLQLLTDVLGHPVTRMPEPEASALGVARMAADALGWPAPAPMSHDADDLFRPAIDDASRAAILAIWHTAVRRTDPEI